MTVSFFFFTGFIAGAITVLSALILELSLTPQNRPITFLRREIEKEMKGTAVAIKRKSGTEKAHEEMERRAQAQGQDGIMLEDYDL